MFNIKVCGITNPEDALLAQESGAEAIGFIFCTSPRQVNKAQVCRITSSLSSGIVKVGVFQNASSGEVLELFHDCRLDLAQFHGAEEAVWADHLGIPYIKGIAAGTRAEKWQTSKAQALLIDNSNGGSGTVFDWERFVDYLTLGKPLILAGGLNKDNIREAIRCCRPAAVDVGSGVELFPGQKDPVKLYLFLQAARDGFRDLPGKL